MSLPKSNYELSVKLEDDIAKWSDIYQTCEIFKACKKNYTREKRSLQMLEESLISKILQDGDFAQCSNATFGILLRSKIQIDPISFEIVENFITWRLTNSSLRFTTFWNQHHVRELIWYVPDVDGLNTRNAFLKQELQILLPLELSGICLSYTNQFETLLIAISSITHSIQYFEHEYESVQNTLKCVSKRIQNTMKKLNLTTFVCSFSRIKVKINKRKMRSEVTQHDVEKFLDAFLPTQNLREAWVKKFMIWKESVMIGKNVCGKHSLDCL